MSKKILLLFFVNFFCGSLAIAQLNPFPSAFIELDSTEKHVLSYQSFYMSNSSSLNARFLQHYQLKPQLSRTIIRQNEPRLQEDNRAGVNFINALSYSINTDSSFLGKNVSFIFSYSHETMAGLAFSGDAFRLALIGNTHYKGESLRISPLNARRESFSRLAAAAYKHNGSWTYGGGIGIVASHSFSFANVDEGLFYTSPDADSLFVRANMSSVQSRTSDTWMGPMEITGAGASAELGVQYRVKKYRILFLLENIGLITRTLPVNYSKADTVISFTGVDYDEFMNGPGRFAGVFAVEQRFTRSSDEINKTRMLPWRVRLHQQMYADIIASEITLGILYEYLPGFSPYIYAIANHQLTQNFDLQGGLTFGGYGGAGLALGASYQFAGISLGLASYNTLSFIMPGDLSGSSLQIKLSKNFTKPVSQETP